MEGQGKKNEREEGRRYLLYVMSALRAPCRAGASALITHLLIVVWHHDS
jgi:hypothetical protein